MLFAGGSRRAAVLAAALLICFTPARAADDAAHKLAEKFAGEKSESPEQSAEARRKAEEARKHEAERLAQEKLKAEARQRAEAALKAEREKQRPVAKKAEPQPPAPRTPTAAEENDILARARAEQEQRKAAEKRDVTDDEARRVIEEAERASRQLEELLAKTEPPTQKPAAVPEQPAAPVAPTPVAEPSLPPPAAKPAVVATEPAPQPAEDEQAKLRAAEAERAAAIAQAKRIWRQSAERQEAQARALAAAEAEKERARIAAATPPPPAPPPTPPAATPVAAPVVPPAPASPAGPPPERVAPLPPPPAAAPPPVVAEAPKPAPGIKPVAAPEAPKAEPATPVPPTGLEARVTVLVVMRPGNYGIRRNDKTADPILCAPDGCYISAGIEAPANFLKGSKALGIGNTFGARSGACRNVLGCVFRAIPVRDASLMLQPVDMHIIKHDRRRPQAVTADSQCGLFGGKLSCNRGIYADDYTLWIVPESVADAVGPDALQRAVKEGLNGPRSATLQPR